MRPVHGVIAALSLGGCAIAPPPACPPALAPRLEARLYFGLTNVDGTPISPAAWQRFVAADVTPAFPDGLTILDTTGQWRDRVGGGIVRQPSRVIEIVAPDQPAVRAALQTIRDRYRAIFHQQSVGLVVMRVCADF